MPARFNEAKPLMPVLIIIDNDFPVSSSKMVLMYAELKCSFSWSVTLNHKESSSLEEE